MINSMAHNCENCKFRAHYDKKPNSFLGKFWRWHINFCPGWKGYFTSQSEEKKAELRAKYNFQKYRWTDRKWRLDRIHEAGCCRNCHTCYPSWPIAHEITLLVISLLLTKLLFLAFTSHLPFVWLFCCLTDFCWRFSFVVGDTIYIGVSNNKQKSYRGSEVQNEQKQTIIMNTGLLLHPL